VGPYPPSPAICDHTALALRFSADPAARLAAIEALRDEVQGALPGGSVTVTAALARLQVRKIDNRYVAHPVLPDGAQGEEG